MGGLRGIVEARSEEVQRREHLSWGACDLEERRPVG